MNSEAVEARSAIESLRSGVPNRHAVAQLGTTQRDVQQRFEEALDSIAAGGAAAPLVMEANFGAGKTHLLEYLQSLAEQRKFVTSYVVVSPEMPLGNAHVVLKAIAESARAPDRHNDKALRALTTDLRVESPHFAELRLWARDSGIHDRFRALLHIYEEFKLDKELRVQILNDFEGKPLLKTEIRKRLKEIGQLAGYDLSGPRNSLLAHDRIRLLARFFRACGCKGLVVLFDELERIAKFSIKQRIAAYQELGWWRGVTEQEGAAILPVFAMTRGFTEETVTGGTQDELRFRSGTLDSAQDEREQQAIQGIELLKRPMSLQPPTAEQGEEIMYRIKQIYEQAYGRPVSDLRTEQGEDLLPIRSRIRRWITLWDLNRYYPDHAAQMQVEEIQFDTHEISDEEMAPDDEDDDQE